MRSGEKGLSAWQVEEYRMAVPQLIRAAFYGEDVAASGVTLVGMGSMGADRLCCPLSPEVLARIRSSASVKWRDADVTYVPNEAAERSGRMIFRVSYEFDGCDASGESFSVRERAVIAVVCGCLGRGLFRKELCVSGVYPCEEQEGVVQLPESPTQARKRLAQRLHAGSCGDTLGDCCVEGLIEVIGEAVIEFIGGLFDGL